jgi:hypothetical protein
MATDITAFLLVDKNNSRGTIPDQNIQYILQLDEGHDRPVWTWVKNLDQDRDPKTISPLVPEMPETILQDGLLLMIAEGIMDEGLRATLNNRRTGQARLYDLNLPAEGDFESLREGIPEALEALTVRLVRLPGCSIKPEKATELAITVVSF